MAYGLRVFNAAGSVVMDTSTVGAAFVETLTLTYNTSSSKTYTAFNGRTLRLFNESERNHNLVVSVDVSGNPVLTWTAISRNPLRARNSYVRVFVK